MVGQEEFFKLNTADTCMKKEGSGTFFFSSSSSVELGVKKDLQNSSSYFF